MIYLVIFFGGFVVELERAKKKRQALDAMARQPEKMGELRSSMIIAAALVEGVAFFAVIIALLALFV